MQCLYKLETALRIVDYGILVAFFNVPTFSGIEKSTRVQRHISLHFIYFPFRRPPGAAFVYIFFVWW